MYYHLRFTPYELPSDTIKNLTSKCTRYVVAYEEHKKNGRPTKPHFHIWMDIDCSLSTMRKSALEILGIPKSGTGKENKYYYLKKWDEKIEYIIKQGKIRDSKGLTDEELRVPPWKPQEEQAPTLAKPEEKIEQVQKKNGSNFWKEILEEAMFQTFQKKKVVDIEEALKIISRVYIKKMLPLPHPGDRKRWATSLVMYAKMGYDPDQDPTLTENLIEQEMTTFMADNMVSNKPI